jgi:hypothetical protein
MSSTTSAAVILPSRTRARSIVAGLAVAAVGAAAAYGITATGLDLIPQQEQHKAGHFDGDGSVRFVAEPISLIVWRAMGTRSGCEVLGSDL